MPVASILTQRLFVGLVFGLAGMLAFATLRAPGRTASRQGILLVSVILIWQGTPMTFEGAATVTTVEGQPQTIARGVAAGVVAIKQLGTNGGGFFNVNAAHPYENPNAWTNLLQTWAIFSLALALAVTFGRMIKFPHSIFALPFALAAFVLATRRGHPGTTH